MPGKPDYRAETRWAARGHIAPKDADPVADRTESARSAYTRPEKGITPSD